MKAELTHRQNQISGLITAGYTQKEIANEFNISIRTVDTTLRNIYEKTGFNKMTELAVWWFAHLKNIEFDREEIKRLAIAMSLLVIVFFELLTSPDFMVRARRVKETEIEYLIIE